jgi:hypothetical protein
LDLLGTFELTWMCLMHIHANFLKLKSYFITIILIIIFFVQQKGFFFYFLLLIALILFCHRSMREFPMEALCHTLATMS